ncbi:MAG: FimV/HubP family polar landmark protein, partial [Pseudomonadota bacterium]
PAVAEPEEVGPGSTSGKDDFEFSLDDFALDAESDKFAAGEPEEPEEPAAAAPSEDQDEDDGFDFLAGADEAATKLDLARAYIDMGDHEGAREILAEVIEEGTEAQSSDARQLIERLD